MYGWRLRRHGTAAARWANRLAQQVPPEPLSDAARAAQAIIDAALSDTPPLRLLLGKTALELARKKLDFMRNDFDAWEATTLGADFPQSGS